MECNVCGAECDSIDIIPVYIYIVWFICCGSVQLLVPASFREELKELFGDRYKDFNQLSNTDITSHVLISEIWEEEFAALLSLVKEFIVDVWEVIKILYGDDSCPGQLQCQSSAGDLWPVAGVGGFRVGEFAHSHNK